MPSDNKLDSPLQHSLEKLELAVREAAVERLSVRKALFLSVVLLSHGHPAVERPVTLLKHNAPEPRVREAAAAMAAGYEKIRTFFRFEKINQELMARFYRTTGYLYLGKEQRSTKLLVIFTSVFNNLYYSNAMLAAMFAGLDCDLLFMKDPSHFGYLKGAEGIADDFPALCDKIMELARKNGIKRIYISGFSAGGFGAMLASLRIPCSGYLGFSHSINRNPNTRFFPPKDDSVLKQFDSRWELDLKDLLAAADPAVPRVLYYGELNERDATHARHVAGLPTITTIGLAKISHNTIRAMFGMNMLLPAFEALVSESSDWPVPTSLMAPAEEELLRVSVREA